MPEANDYVLRRLAGGPGERPSAAARVLQVAGIGAGVTAYLYAVGGVGEYLRFAGKSLPATAALSVVDARQILLIGSVATVLIGLAMVPVVVGERGFAWIVTNLSSADGAPPAATESWWRVLAYRVGLGSAVGVGAGVTAFLAALVFGRLGTSVLSFGTEEALYAAIAASLAAGALASFLPFVWSRARLTWTSFWEDRNRPVRLVLGLGVVFIVGMSLAWFLPLRLRIAQVQLSDGKCVRGLFLDRNGDGVHLLSAGVKPQGAVKGNGRVGGHGRIKGQPARMFTVDSHYVAAVQIGRLVDVNTIRIASYPCYQPVNLVSSATVADDALALVYLERVLEDRAQLVSAITDDWRIKPPLPDGAFNVPVTDSAALLEADVPSRTLRDLAAFHGQLEITYDGWQSSDQRIKLTPTDRRRVCRTIAFADRVQNDLFSLPGSGHAKFDAAPEGCKHAPLMRSHDPPRSASVGRA